MPWFEVIKMAKIDDKLYLGNVFDAADLVKDNPNGIEAVLNVSTEPEYPHRDDVVYQQIPFHDGYEIPPEKFAQCMSFLTKHQDKRILVHCAAGISRSATIVVSWLVYSRGMEWNHAYHLVKLCRPIIGPAPAVVISAKKHLHCWPYDGSMSEEQAVTVDSRHIWEQVKADTLTSHPDADCVMRRAILDSREWRIPKHLMKCTCKR